MISVLIIFFYYFIFPNFLLFRTLKTESYKDKTFSAKLAKENSACFSNGNSIKFLREAVTLNACLKKSKTTGITRQLKVFVWSVWVSRNYLLCCHSLKQLQ